MTFGYPSFYANGLNSNSQLRRSTDMIYQRGGTYEIVLTGDTYQTSMQLSVDLYADDDKVGRMSLVAYDISQSGGTYTYKFNLRPYDYLSNYVQAEHYQYYWLNDWETTSEQINIDNPYANKIKANFKYGYSFFSNSTPYYEPLTGSTPTLIFEGLNNDFNHFTDIPNCVTQEVYSPSGFTNTGQYFDYVGGQFQFDNRYILQNYDQEIGTVIGTGITLNEVDFYRGLSPMSQFLMDYPTLPQTSQTSRFLTESPRIQYIQSEENYVLYYLNGQTADRQVIETDYVMIEFYDYNNTKITGITQQLNLVGTPYASPTGFTDTLRIFALPCGPVDITNLLYSGITWDNVAYYTVQLGYAFPTGTTGRTYYEAVGPTSEMFYFYLYDNCLPQNTRIAWLNVRGGYDYYTFQSYRQNTNKIKRESYDNRYYSPSVPSPDRNIGRVTKTFATDVDQEIVLESDYLNLQYAHWLEDLFTSPQVYLVNEDFVSPIDNQNKIYKDLTPLQIISTEVNHITKKHQKLNKYKITFSTGNNYFTNRGF
jgi:hypothetical protein